jgi:hypothetical protein
MRKAERDKWVNALVDQFFQQEYSISWPKIACVSCKRSVNRSASASPMASLLGKNWYRAYWQAGSRGDRLVLTASKPMSAKTSSLAQSG